MRWRILILSPSSVIRQDHCVVQPVTKLLTSLDLPLWAAAAVRLSAVNRILLTHTILWLPGTNTCFYKCFDSWLYLDVETFCWVKQPLKMSQSQYSWKTPQKPWMTWRSRPYDSIKPGSCGKMQKRKPGKVHEKVTNRGSLWILGSSANLCKSCRLSVKNWRT